MKNPVDDLRQSLAGRPSQSLEETKESEFIIIRLGESLFALPLADVLQVVAVEKVYPVPGSPVHFLGVINVRSSIETVFNIKSFLGLQAQKENQTKGLLIAVTGLQTVMMVDDVLDILKVRDSDIHTTPRAPKSPVGRHLKGEFSWSSQSVMIINLSSVFAELADGK